MSIESQDSAGARMATTISDPAKPTGAAAPVCPACDQTAQRSALERLGKSVLFQCTNCELHVWEPRAMPDACWYEQMYGGRDEN